MKLSDYIKKHHNGIQSHFAAFHDIPCSRVNELLKSDNAAFIFSYANEEGEIVTSIFKEGRTLDKLTKSARPENVEKSNLF